ncbi:hypothetical protein C440_07512 [Haloferax mucosum ATCC BAA-1512]|uniref:Uncharacterized protein n=1 Tax=Haloferax mucosum ATCC BAA-1512 TaxID=662479 RepID=M0IDQ0_9EURY|nr:hypothetical protein [Haloferax mucosum]ELZ94905.1 hypothetical protein C440_07512 [Haloferax mucosum ATCC BAA-1512]
METLRYNPGLINVGNARPINADDLDKVTLKAGTEVPIYSKKVKNDKLLFWGAGGKDRESADTKFFFCDLVATGNGTGTAGDAVRGELIAVITDSDQERVKAEFTLGDLGHLADARTSDNPMPVMYALAPYAKPGRHIELRIRASSSSDGVEIDNTEDPGNASSARLWYSQVSN